MVGSWQESWQNLGGILAGISAGSSQDLGGNLGKILPEILTGSRQESWRDLGKNFAKILAGTQEGSWKDSVQCLARSYLWWQLFSGLESDDAVPLTSGSIMACSCPADWKFAIFDLEVPYRSELQ